MITFLLILAIILRLAGGISYFHATWKGQARPSLVSWFFWSVTPIIAFAVQIHENVGLPAFVTLALGIGPAAVFILALRKGKYIVRFSTSDKISAIFAFTGIALWLITNDPLTALFFSIAADFFSSIPTILKSYKDPDSERALPYFLSLISMVITLACIVEWDASHVAFPLYILAINSVFFTLVQSRIGLRLRQKPSKP